LTDENFIKSNYFFFFNKCIDGNREFNLNLAIKAQTITNGLKYSLATGNWGDQKKAMQVKIFEIKFIKFIINVIYIQHLFWKF
jgi:hypothetical protein